MIDQSNISPFIVHELVISDQESKVINKKTYSNLGKLGQSMNWCGSADKTTDPPPLGTWFDSGSGSSALGQSTLSLFPSPSERN